jgi:hypothetical protein
MSAQFAGPNWNASPAASSPGGGVHRCTVIATNGHRLTDGIAVLIYSERCAEARLTELSEPGALLIAYLGRGVSRYVLALDDGHTIGAELVNMVWQQPGRRLCRFLLDTTASD